MADGQFEVTVAAVEDDTVVVGLVKVEGAFGQLHHIGMLDAGLELLDVVSVHPAFLFKERAVLLQTRQQ